MHSFKSSSYMIMRYLLTSLAFTSLLWGLSSSQTTDDNDLDFSQIDVENQPECLSNCLIKCSNIDSPHPDCSGGNPKQGCTTNECLCGNTERLDRALEVVRSCARWKCDSSEDRDLGISLVLEYCRSKGFDVLSTSSTTSRSTTITTTATSTAETTSSPSSTTDLSTTDVSTTGTDKPEPSTTFSSGAQSSSSSSTQPSEDSNNNDSNSGGSSKDEFGKAEIAGTVVGVVSAVAAVIGIWLQLKRRKEKKKEPSTT